jgi:hypothetical protein
MIASFVHTLLLAECGDEGLVVGGNVEFLAT